jgi:hypothetical protein
MGAHILLPVAVNSKSEQKVKSSLLPPLGLELATFGTLVRLFDRSAKSHHVGADVTIHDGMLFVFLQNLKHQKRKREQYSQPLSTTPTLPPSALQGHHSKYDTVQWRLNFVHAYVS